MPLLRLDLAQEPRLLEIETNTRQCLGETQRMEWLGEVAGLREACGTLPPRNSRPNAYGLKPIEVRTPLTDLDARSLTSGAALIVVRLGRQGGPGAFVGHNYQAYGHVP
ncbi:hypothetical protein OG936_36125 [Streptomyces sp. NBC_00846]|uniref:hypothetical protein n=1 Tax=Streptomyces sp. NBC_00846 TaxID=2975849 RepID=UPI00386CE80A|nr:hypothetical protein OG936_36125 [Streptomyces sp. NBC_00846]